MTFPLVYSELASRRQAMASFSHQWGAEQQLTDGTLLAELGNGHAAAARFDRDLRALEVLASPTPAFTVAPSDSPARAEILLVVAYVDMLDGGCDGRGGAIVTDLPAIVWGANRGGHLHRRRHDRPARRPLPLHRRARSRRHLGGCHQRLLIDDAGLEGARHRLDIS